MKHSDVWSRSVFFSAGLGFLVGVCVAGGIAYSYFQPAPVRLVRESDFASSSAYALIDPLMSVSIGTNPSPTYKPLYDQIGTYISQQETAGLSEASVNFRDVDLSDGFTVNPDATYDPASLTKVPLAMAYYALAEQDPSVLEQTIEYSGQPDLDATEQIESPTQLTPGQSYTVEELIEHMIRYSDNNAEQLLADHLSDIDQLNILSTLYQDLGVKINPDNTDYATVGSYSTFLRVLYNSTYLDRDYSEQLLQLLTETDFTGGIEAGVPNDTVVAEKFGEARVPNAQGTIVGAELQDCGIVYYPNHPYILCIMSKGQSIQELEGVIAGVSKIVYQNIEVRYPTQS